MNERLIDIAEDSAKGGFFLLAGNVSSIVILAIGSIIVARLLGPENYGVYSLSLIVPTILSGLTDFGIGPALTRFSAKFRAEGRSSLIGGILKSGFLSKLISSVAMFIVCFIFSDLFAAYILNRPEIGFLVKIASFLIFLQAVYTALNSSFIGFDRMQGSALIMNSQAVVKTTLSPLLVILGFGVIGALTGHILCYLIAGLVGIATLFKYYRELTNQSSYNFSSNLKTMLSYGFPLYLSALIVLFLSQYQTIIIAQFASNFEVGNFAIAVHVSTVAISVVIFPLRAIFPAFSKIDPDSDMLKKAFSLSVKYFALLAIPATVGIAILSRDLVYTIYGHSFSLAPLFLSLYILVFLYTGFGYNVLGYLLSGIGKTKIHLKMNLMNLIIFLPLALILANFYGVPGMIVAFLISTFLALTYGLSFTIKETRVYFDLKSSAKIYLSSILSAIPMITFLHLSSLNSLLNILIGGSIFIIIYLTLTPLAGAIQQSDLDNFRRVFEKIRIIRPLANLGLFYEAEMLKLRSHWKSE